MFNSFIKDPFHQLRDELAQIGVTLAKLYKVISHTDPSTKEVAETLYKKYRYQLLKVIPKMDAGWAAIEYDLSSGRHWQSLLPDKKVRLWVLERLKKDVATYFFTPHSLPKLQSAENSAENMFPVNKAQIEKTDSTGWNKTKTPAKPVLTKPVLTKPAYSPTTHYTPQSLMQLVRKKKIELKNQLEPVSSKYRKK